MAITTMDGLASAITTAENQHWFRSVAASSGNWASFWAQSGAPGAGATPPSGAGESPNNTTTGAIPFTTPAGGLSAYLTRVALSSSTQNGKVIIYDRVVHTSGLSGTSTSAQTVNSAAIDRTDTTGLNVELWVEWYTATGGTSASVTVSYTNESNTSGRTSVSVALGNTIPASRIYPLPLQAGDFGVRSVQSVTMSANTGTAGNFGVTLMKPIAVINCGIPNSSAATTEVRDALSLALPKLDNKTCLAVAYFPTGGAATAFHGLFQIASG